MKKMLIAMFELWLRAGFEVVLVLWKLLEKLRELLGTELTNTFLRKVSGSDLLRNSRPWNADPFIDAERSKEWNQQVAQELKRIFIETLEEGIK